MSAKSHPSDHLTEDTIAAIATPFGQAGIGIIRISGPKAPQIVQKLFKPHSPTRVFRTHRLYLGHLIDPASGGVIDEVLLSFMKAPHSYTKEDVVEVNSHSGLALLSKILQIVLDEGARLANPGEFTLRAFLNGRIDLTQAEAVVDLINAKSERGLRLASGQMQGALREKLDGLRLEILDILAQLEAAIDFPEEEATSLDCEAVSSRVKRELLDPIEEIMTAHRHRKLWLDGIDTVIVGRVNAGKSSLLNRLLDEERAIVTPIPGTTRDIIESIIQIEGLPLKLMDTAGIRCVGDEVERIGVQRSEERLAEADLALVVVDRSRPLNEDDLAVLAKSEPGKSIVVLNKIDLIGRLDDGALMEAVNGSPVVRISALTGEGLSDLRRSIRDVALEGSLEMTTSHLVPNLRQKQALEEASRCFGDAVHNLQEAQPLEIVAADLTAGLDALGEIIGKTTTQAVLDRIFEQFCLGK
jgi:tRNA modification GTPase